MQYERISFGAGALTAQQLNKLVSNMDFLHDRMIEGHYFVNEHQKENGLRINSAITGVAKPLNDKVRYADIFWPRPFLTGCKPVITTGHYFTKMMPVTIGLHAVNGELWPDNRGVRVEVGLQTDTGLFATSPKWGNEPTVFSLIALGW